MDNQFYYGENKIIGHRDLAINEYDMLISYGGSISTIDKNTVYLQYGLIYKETTVKRFSKYLQKENKQTLSGYEDNPYRNEGIGFGLNVDKLKECIESQSNTPFWNSGYYKNDGDLRNPKNIEIKREIFRTFGLNADKNYEENLKLQK